jgi:hypothetical protein
MDIEFDSDKDAINRDKHGVSLGFGVRVIEAPGSLVIPSLRDIDGEPRFKTVGLIEGRLWTAVWYVAARKSGSFR